MARQAGKATRNYFDEFAISGVTNVAELEFEPVLPDVTCFSDAAEEFVEGPYGSRGTVNGFFDGDDDEWDEQIDTAMGDGAKHYLGVGVNGDTSGKIMYELQGQIEGRPHSIERAGAILLNFTLQGEGGTVRATVLDNQAVTATGAVAGSNQNVGTSSSGQTLVGTLRVLSVSGSGSITVAIEESSDDGSGDAYSSIIAFTAKTAIGVERKTITTATETWKRINVTAFSGFTSVTILVTVGIEQGT